MVVCLHDRETFTRKRFCSHMCLATTSTSDAMPCPSEEKNPASHGACSGKGLPEKEEGRLAEEEAGPIELERSAAWVQSSFPPRSVRMAAMGE
eukprot:2677663-Rhodomonas_salina.4